VFDVRQAAEAVVLDLEEPVGMVEGLTETREASGEELR
jgi:hypothetical protein